MAIIKCKMCGGDLEIIPGITVAECEYCGTKQTLPKANEEVIRNLFNRAHALRLKCEFDKAEQIYEKIVQEDNTEAEAHWGIVLCKYGIEYVEDPKNYKRIPTCHRTSYDAVTADADYLAAIQYADVTQRGIYEAEAKAIDEIQKNILTIVKEEKPFDVFLCYKETDEDGKRTMDSAIANDIYHQLTQEGLKVFYAAITLEAKLGHAYEPYIFAALNTAKVMLVIGTKPQFFTAVWVKNEWSRFLKLMKTDRSKLLIPCYRDMDAYELPEEFAHLQAQDMSKIGFINDVVRGIKKVTDKGGSQPAVVKETVVAGNTNIAPLLKRAFMFLEDGDWTSANEYCEKVLDIDPECAEAYLGKLMAELQVKKQEKLQDCAKPFDGKNNYQKVLRFADDDLKATLAGYIDSINARNKSAQLEAVYTRATRGLLEKKRTEDHYKEVAKLFESIKQYKDASEKAKESYIKAESARKNEIYRGANAKLSGEIILNDEMKTLESAMYEFQSISGWKDADEKAKNCQFRIDELKAEAEHSVHRAKRNMRIAVIVVLVCFLVSAVAIYCVNIAIPNGLYNEAVDLMESGKYTEAIAAFEVLDGYKDSAEKIDECNLVMLEEKYNDAIEAMNEGNLDEAYSLFSELWDYKDADEKANDILSIKAKEELNNAKVGDYITFGAYEQDGYTSNGNEDIKWLVLEVKDGKMLVISKYALDCKPYNTSYADVTWESCTLRTWLNNDFINTAFSSVEKSMIPEVTVATEENWLYGTDSGNTTQDRVFLLSLAEANKYFSSDDARLCEPTNYAVFNGANVNGINSNCWWRLRSPGYNQKYAVTVNYYGAFNESGNDVNNLNDAIRPALWIDMNT